MADTNKSLGRKGLAARLRASVDIKAPTTTTLTTDRGLSPVSFSDLLYSQVDASQITNNQDIDFLSDFNASFTPPSQNTTDNTPISPQASCNFPLLETTINENHPTSNKPESNCTLEPSLQPVQNYLNHKNAPSSKHSYFSLNDLDSVVTSSSSQSIVAPKYNDFIPPSLQEPKINETSELSNCSQCVSDTSQPPPTTHTSQVVTDKLTSTLTQTPHIDTLRNSSKEKLLLTPDLPEDSKISDPSFFTIENSNEKSRSFMKPHNYINTNTHPDSHESELSFKNISNGNDNTKFLISQDIHVYTDESGEKLQQSHISNTTEAEEPTQNLNTSPNEKSLFNFNLEDEVPSPLIKGFEKESISTINIANFKFKDYNDKTESPPPKQEHKRLKTSRKEPLEHNFLSCPFPLDKIFSSTAFQSLMFEKGGQDKENQIEMRLKIERCLTNLQPYNPLAPFLNEAKPNVVNDLFHHYYNTLRTTFPGLPDQALSLMTKQMKASNDQSKRWKPSKKI